MYSQVSLSAAGSSCHFRLRPGCSTMDASGSITKDHCRLVLYQKHTMGTLNLVFDVGNIQRILVPRSVNIIPVSESRDPWCVHSQNRIAPCQGSMPSMPSKFQRKTDISTRRGAGNMTSQCDDKMARGQDAFFDGRKTAARRTSLMTRRSWRAIRQRILKR
jgi:hypothetical protein